MRGENAERGSVTLLVAISLLAIMGFLAVSLDLGRAYVAEERLRGVAQAAALAGAAELPVSGFSTSAAETAAENTAAENGVSGAVVSVTQVAGGAYAVAVQASGSVDFPFGAVLGIPRARLGAQAAAEVGAPSDMTGLAPLAVPEQNFQFGQEYVLRAAPGSDGGGYYQEGNYGFLSLGGEGDEDDLEDLEHGYRGVVELGQEVETKPGYMANLNAAIEERISEDPGATYRDVAPDSPRLLLMPVVSGDPRGRSEVQVVGFAAFFLEGAENDGGNVAIYGRFLQETLHGRVTSGTNIGGLWAEEPIPWPPS